MSFSVALSKKQVQTCLAAASETEVSERGFINIVIKYKKFSVSFLLMRVLFSSLSLVPLNVSQFVLLLSATRSWPANFTDC